MAILQFPDGFLWGTATSSFQIEGGADAAGRGESIWDRFCATPGKIEDGGDARVACDHYHLWRDDVERMKWLGTGAYRFSIAWPRVVPNGGGVVKKAGLDFYDRLVDGLLEAGITPFVTLYHWDLPQALQDHGGWAARPTAEAFADYTDAVSSRLGDRVRHWITHNEPWCVATLGHEEGHHAPGHTDAPESLRVAHHVMLSHGWAVQVLRRNVPDARVGITLNLVPAYPLSPDDPDDLDAVRYFDGFFNRWYLDPIFRGHYPDDAIADRVRRGHLEAAELPFLHPGDLDAISAPVDFLGVNYYSRVVVRAGEGGVPVAQDVVPEEERTDMGWEVYPQGLYDLLVRVHTDYRPRGIYITENGAAYGDGPDDGGRVHDERRIDYLRSHFGAAHGAIADGVPLRGYFVWSFMDNFEWAHGYRRRFGLYWVDFETRARVPKDSAFWYRGVAAANAVNNTPGSNIGRTP
jgi:beta-glucosidase